MTRSTLVMSALLAGSTVLAGTVLAHAAATGIVKERMDLMKTIGDRTKTLSKMFKGEAPYDAATVQEAAADISEHSGEQIVALFPEGSLDEDSDALPAIWQERERFADLAQQLGLYSAALAEAADNPRPGDGMIGDGQGMMGDGQGMMGDGGGMMGDGGGMMMSTAADPDPEMLAEMPPDAAFRQLAQTCGDCHSDFRAKDEDR